MWSPLSDRARNSHKQSTTPDRTRRGLVFIKATKRNTILLTTLQCNLPIENVPRMDSQAYDTFSFRFFWLFSRIWYGLEACERILAIVFVSKFIYIYCIFFWRSEIQTTLSTPPPRLSRLVITRPTTLTIAPYLYNDDSSRYFFYIVLLNDYLHSWFVWMFRVWTLVLLSGSLWRSTWTSVSGLL